MGSNGEDELAEARALLQKGAKVFLKHDHESGFLLDTATWEGEYHLAYIQESCDPETNRFKALWKRGGYAVTITCTLHSPSQVLLDANLETMAVQIEDDDTGKTYQDARIMDLCPEQPGEARIRYISWGGKEETVNLSQVSFGMRGRKRRKVHAAAGKAEVAVSKREKTAQGGAKAKGKAAGKGRDKPNDKVSGLREEDAIVIDSSSESSEEEDGGASLQTQPSGKLGDGSDEDEDEDEDEQNEEGNDFSARRKQSWSDWRGQGELGNWGDVDEEMDNEVNDFLAAEGSTLLTNSDSQGSARRGGSPSGGSLGSDEGGAEEEGSTSSHISEESEMEEEGTASEGTSGPTSEIARKRRVRSVGDSSSSGLDSRKKVARKKAARTGTSISSSSGEGQTCTPRVTPRKSTNRHIKDKGILMHGFCRSIPEMKRPHQTIEAVQSILEKAGECGDDTDQLKEALVDANMLLQESLYDLGERTTLVKAASNDGKSPESSPPQTGGNKGLIVQLARQFGLSQDKIDDLFGRLPIIDGYYSIHRAIPMIRKMKGDDSPSEGEAGGASEKNAAGAEDGMSNSSERGAARAEDGMSLENGSIDEGGKGAESMGGTGEKHSNLLGNRVRTVLEDGREYEGTVSTVHYRVTYDDKDTETYLTEAEVFENLACNEKYLNGPDEIRCSMLELFSGCSLLSTMCKRKGMHVTSVDNDPESNATMKADFASESVQSFLLSQWQDYTHASPVCRTYSNASGGYHRITGNYNITPDSHEADAMLLQLYFFLRKALETNKEMTVTIENPVGWMQQGNCMKELFEGELGFRKVVIYYCQFGRADKKPTCVWTNDEKLAGILESVGGKCTHRKHREGLNHPDQSVRNRSRGKNFAALPMKLCQLISSYVHSKHTQLKLEKLASNENDLEGESC